jgi:hypothetical protein
MVRAWANVSMFCSTHVADHAKNNNPSTIKRSDLICKIYYVAQGKKISAVIYSFLYLFFFLIFLNFILLTKLCMKHFRQLGLLSFLF